MTRRREREMRRAVLLFCRMKGCTCEPEITFVGKGTVHSPYDANVAHDDTCLFLQRLRAENN